LRSSDGELTRRELLVAGALAAGYALAARPVSAQAILTDSEGLVAGPVEIPGKDAPLPAYRARPDSEGDFPVVLVVHEIFGVHEYIRDVCRRLAKQGFLAVAPDLYWRQGDVSEIGSIQEIIERVVRKVPDSQVLSDLDAALDWAHRHQGAGGPAGVTGFCWGGRIVWLYAALRGNGVVGAAWYGRLDGGAREQTPRHPIDLAGEELGPVLGLYGGADPGIPLDTVFAMRKELAESNPRSEILIFPEAPHGFHADYRPSYRREDAREAWGRMLEWFRRQGVGDEERAVDPPPAP
jgi:carboxymethylenebutenolidase